MIAGVDTGSLWVGEIDNPQANSGGSDGSFSGGIYYFSNLELHAVIDWGDGSNQEGTTISFSGNNPSGNNPAINARQFEVSAGHVYAGTGDYTIGIFVTEHDNDFAYIEDPLTVHENSGGGMTFNLPGTQGNTEGEGVGFNISATPVDSSITHYWISGQPAGISIDDNGRISGTIDSSASQVNDGVYSVTVTAEDSNGVYGSAGFSWLVSSSDTIVFSPGTRYDTAGSTASTITIHTEPTTAGTTATYFSMSGAPDGLEINHQYGTISGNISSNAADDAYDIVIDVTDSRGAHSSTHFDWRVFRGSNIITITNPGDQSNAEGDYPYLSFPATSSNGYDITSYQIYGQPGGIGIGDDGVLTGSIDYAAAETNGGVYSVVVGASDSNNATSYVDFKWTVTNYDPPPILETPATTTQAAGTTLNLTVAHDCPDGTAITGYGLSISPALPNVLTINGDGVISGTLPSNAGGVYDVTVTATNSNDLDAEPIDFILIVSDGNHTGPTITTPASQTPHELDAVSVPITATPPSGHSVAFYQISDQPSGIDIDPQTGEIYGSPDLGTTRTNDYAARVTATDDDGGQTTTYISFNVGIAKPVIDPSGDQTNYAEDIIDLPTSAIDPNGYGLTYSIDGPNWLGIDSQTGEITSIDPNTGLPAPVPDSAPSATAYAVSVTATNTQSISTTNTIQWMVPPVADTVVLTGGLQLGEAFNTPTQLNVATFTDANPAAKPSIFTATIDWNDGTGPQAATVTGPVNGLFQVRGEHTYANNQEPYSLQTNYGIIVKVVANSNGVYRTVDSNVLVGALMANVQGSSFYMGSFNVASFYNPTYDPSPHGFAVTSAIGSDGTTVPTTIVPAADGKYNIFGDTYEIDKDSYGESGGSAQPYVLTVTDACNAHITIGNADGINCGITVVAPPINVVGEDVPAVAPENTEVATFSLAIAAPAYYYADFNASVTLPDNSTVAAHVTAGNGGLFHVLLNQDLINQNGIKRFLTVNVGLHGFVMAQAAVMQAPAPVPQLKYDTIVPVVTGTWGAYEWDINWKLAQPTTAATGGWIVQKMTYSRKFYDNGKNVTASVLPAGSDFNASNSYWEAWPVAQNADTFKAGKGSLGAAEGRLKILSTLVTNVVAGATVQNNAQLQAISKAIDGLAGANQISDYWWSKVITSAKTPGDGYYTSAVYSVTGTAFFIQNNNLPTDAMPLGGVEEAGVLYSAKIPNNEVSNWIATSIKNGQVSPSVSRSLLLTWSKKNPVTIQLPTFFSVI